MSLQTIEFKNRFYFANDIITNRRKNKRENKLRSNLTIWEKNYAFDIIHDFSEDINLVQLMDSPENVNHAISIVGHWIFDSSYEKSLCFTQEFLYIICYPSIGKELTEMFQSIFYAVWDSWAPNHILKW